MGAVGTTALARAFMELFAGLDSAYGTYDLSKPNIREDGKRGGVAATRRGKVTQELWEGHLTGEGAGLGIVPICADDSCTFGAIDVDVYKGLSHQAIAQKLSQYKVPMVVCRTKSGGAHLYIFSKLPIPAAKMKSKLGEVASIIGYGDCEIFPKQGHIVSEHGDVGNWINMPYFGGLNGMRYAVKVDGDAMSPSEFLEYAEGIKVDGDWFSEKIVPNTEFADGPPCLQALAQIGYPPGTRNDGLMAIGVYLKKSRPDEWENLVEEYNYKYMDPPLVMPEVQGVIKSLRKKDYSYSCTKQPICTHCNAALCHTRKFGVGSGTSGRFPLLGGLTKLNTKPPLWFWNCNGIRIELSTSELQDPRQFQRKCVDYLNLMPQMPSKPVWEAAVQNALDSVTVIDAPADASPEGQFWDMLEKFCTGRAQALALDEMLLGKPYTSDGRTHFRMQDLLSYLSTHKFAEFKSTKIASMLRDSGAQHHFSILKGRGVNYWSVTEFKKQTEGFDVPKEAQGAKEPF